MSDVKEHDTDVEQHVNATPPRGFERLREAFPPEQVGLLPRVTCKACSDAQFRVCDKHGKAKCDDCGAWITSAHMHLDYVGHGAVTDRLLEVDPHWNWEPLATDEHGLPLMTTDSRGNPVEMWIRLTVLGVTRLGVGTCPAGQFDAAKVLIGDALRNAAMRFGVALDLWIKGHAEDDEQSTASDNRPAPERGLPDVVLATPEQKGRIKAWLATASTAAQNELRAWWKAQRLPPVKELDKFDTELAARVLSHMEGLAPAAEEPGEGAPTPLPGDSLPLEEGANA